MTTTYAFIAGLLAGPMIIAGLLLLIEKIIDSMGTCVHGCTLDSDCQKCDQGD